MSEMVIQEGRKEDIFSKYQRQIQAEKHLVKEYLGGAGLGSIYDYLITDLFMIDTNFKYLDDILRNYYSDWRVYEEDIIPLNYNDAKRWVENKRDEMDRLVEALKFFDVHNKKYEYPEFRKYADGDLFNFLKETDELKEEFTKKKGEKEVQKVYEDDRVLVVKPLSYESSCVYGAGTRWCTSSKSTSTHFQNYSETGTLYYLITKGVDSSNKFYKVALYRDHSGADKWYDATDRELAENEVELLTSAYGEAMKLINEDYAKHKIVNPVLSEVFPPKYSVGVERKFLTGKPKIDLFVNFSVKDSQDPELVELRATIFLIQGDNEKIIGEYPLKVKTDSTPTILTSLIQFGTSNIDDVNLSGDELVVINSVVGKSPQVVKEQFYEKLFERIYFRIRNNQKFLNTLVSKDVILVPSQSKGYSFKYRDRGLIKKLTDWLDSGKKGGKLEFLVSSNILKKRGDDFIATSTKNVIEPRGYLTNFFNSASAAGIISHKKVGRKTFITKGPNYTKFKKGAQLRYF